MTKQDFIEKWLGWVSYTDREKLKHEMENDLEAISSLLRVGAVVPSLPADRWDAEDFLIEKGISNHPRVSDCSNKESYEVADLMAEFANRYYGNRR